MAAYVLIEKEWVGKSDLVEFFCSNLSTWTGSRKHNFYDFRTLGLEIFYIKPFDNPHPQKKSIFFFYAPKEE